MKKQIQISTFTHNGQDVEVLYNKGKISYVFDIGGKRFGNSVKVEGRKALDIVNASWALIINYLETYERANK